MDEGQVQPVNQTKQQNSTDRGICKWKGGANCIAKLGAITKNLTHMNSILGENFCFDFLWTFILFPQVTLHRFEHLKYYSYLNRCDQSILEVSVT